MNNEPVAWLWNEDGCNLGVVLDQDKQIGKQEFQDYDIPLYTHPAKTPAKQKYDDCMKDCDEPNPIERLRFFLSCALTGQDWLDVEPFIDAITHPAKTLTDEEISEVMYQCDWQYDPESFAKAILRKAQEK